MKVVITSPFGPRNGTWHHGVDCNFEAAVIPVLEQPRRLLFSGKSFGYDINGKRLDDWVVIYEGENFYWSFSHLQEDGLPQTIEEIRTRGYVAKHVVGHHAWGTHTHIGCFQKLGTFTSISDAEARGWAIDPVTSGFWPIDDMDRLQFFKDVFWTVNGYIPNNNQIKEWEDSSREPHEFVRDHYAVPRTELIQRQDRTIQQLKEEKIIEVFRAYVGREPSTGEINRAKKETDARLVDVWVKKHFQRSDGVNRQRINELLGHITNDLNAIHREVS